MPFTILLDPRVIDEVQEAVNYYDEQLDGLGSKFLNHLDSYFKSLSINPFYQNRYDDIYCFPLKKFPFMIHYSIDKKEKLVYVHAVINTKKNPENFWIK